jgi:hypothetical protein
LLAAAQLYAQRGWHLVPVYLPTTRGCTCGNGECDSAGKHPTVSDWTRVNYPPKAWANGKQRSIGLVTGAASGIVVIDVDAGGEETLAQLEREHGKLPPTVEVRTGGGGRHLYFKHPGVPIRNDAKKRLGPGLDVRGDGGFVVAAPSLHKSGRRYESIAGHGPGEVATATMPEWMLARLREPERVAPPPPAPRPPAGGGPRERAYGLAALDGACQTIGAAVEGTRNDTLNTQSFKIGQLVGGGILSRPEAEDALVAAGLSVGLLVKESHATVRSGLNDGEKEPRGLPAPALPAPPSREPGADDGDEPSPPESENPKGPGKAKSEPYIKAVLTPMSAVKARPVRWLWKGRVPYGKQTIIDGDPGNGKSTIALDIAARLSKGLPMPWETEPSGDPGNVVVVSVEDDPADTIKPRLMAAGADDKRIYSLSIKAGEAELIPTLAAHMPEILQALQDTKALMLILDPISAVLGDGVDMWKDGDVRRVLGPLKTVLGQTGTAEIGIRHWNKTRGGGSALYAGGGSIGIAAQARSVLCVARNPQDPDQRVCALVKGSNAEAQGGRRVPSLAYRMELVQLGDIETTRINWEGVSPYTADELLAVQVPESGEDRGALDEAKAFLLEVLKPGEWMLAKNLQRAAKDAEIKERTLKRGRKQLGVVARIIDGKRMVKLPVRSPFGTVGTDADEDA